MGAPDTPPSIEQLILLIRQHRVILDTDLARIYGVTTKRLNEHGALMLANVLNSPAAVRGLMTPPTKHSRRIGFTP